MVFYHDIVRCKSELLVLRGISVITLAMFGDKEFMVVTYSPQYCTIYGVLPWQDILDSWPMSSLTTTTFVAPSSVSDMIKALDSLFALFVDIGSLSYGAIAVHSRCRLSSLSELSTVALVFYNSCSDISLD